MFEVLEIIFWQSWVYLVAWFLCPSLPPHIALKKWNSHLVMLFHTVHVAKTASTTRHFSTCCHRQAGTVGKQWWDPGIPTMPGSCCMPPPLGSVSVSSEADHMSCNTTSSPLAYSIFAGWSEPRILWRSSAEIVIRLVIPSLIVANKTLWIHSGSFHIWW